MSLMGKHFTLYRLDPIYFVRSLVSISYQTSPPPFQCFLLFYLSLFTIDRCRISPTLVDYALVVAHMDTVR